MSETTNQLAAINSDVLRMPSTGRIVYYFPNGQDDELGFSHPQKMAAIVVDGVDTAPDLCVFTRWPERPMVTKLSVQHKSAVRNANGNYVGSYWDWREIR